jgi:ubiquinol-cytochrome c reductase cytochrome c1 subunit
MSKRLIIAAALLAASAGVSAAGGALQLLSADPDLGDRASLQNGAKLFVNYCMGCHSMEYMRYKRMGEDLGLSDEQVAQNLMFAADKVVEPMGAAMSDEDGELWFGVAPPDLSVIARSRGADWIYSYLVTFYQDDDPARSFGVNNVVFAGAGMPHVLWDLQGHQRYVPATVDGEVVKSEPTGLSVSRDGVLVHTAVTVRNGDEENVVQATDRLEVSIPGSLSPGQFRGEARDLVNFLVYAGEPAQMVRYNIGFWVLAFLAVFFVVARMLYKEYWKDVH